MITKLLKEGEKLCDDFYQTVFELVMLRQYDDNFRKKDNYYKSLIKKFGMSNSQKRRMIEKEVRPRVKALLKR